MAERGYAATTIRDVVAHAHTSKRTFYEHFESKQACYLEAYREGSDRLRRRMLAAGTTQDGPWRERLRAAIAAYLRVLVEAPASTRTFALEIQAAGPAAHAERRAMHRATAEAMSEVVAVVGRDEPAVGPLSAVQADAFVGALTELVQIAMAEDDLARLAAVEEPLLELLCALVERRAGPAAG